MKKLILNKQKNFSLKKVGSPDFYCQPQAFSDFWKKVEDEIGSPDFYC